MKKWIAGIIAASTLGGGGAVLGADSAQNPYKDLGTHYELPISGDFKQGERVLISKEEASMTIQGWNGEYNITVKPQIPAGDGFVGGVDRDFNVEADRDLMSRKMEYTSGSVTAFIEPRAGTENEFDIDYILHAKPDTNIFDYVIEGVEDFDFFYQPELTIEEVARGENRPENVVGSYAVYHKTKRDHIVGLTNYATGKVFHIYRPKAIDANGIETWADLNYENGKLSVTVPQDFLEKATYPVHVDPTFGNTVAGASNALYGANTLFVAGTSTLSETGIVKNIRWYGRNFGTNVDAKGIIYSDSSNYPATLQASSTAVTVEMNGHFNYWISLPFTEKIVTLSAGAYWLGHITTGNAVINYDTSSKDSHDAAGTYANPESTYPAADADGSQYYSGYATYCLEGQECEEVFNTGGTFTWTAPTGVTSAKVACWGGGGGGFDDGTGTNGGAGGGGGAFASSTVALTPASNYTIIVATSSPESLPATGKFSRFVADDKTVLACGGTGGTSATANGVGGTTACSTGDVESAGGVGADAVTTDDTGGGGGGAGGPAGTGGAAANGSATVGGGGGGGNGGGAASAPTGGTAGPNAGAGGDGVTTSFDGAVSHGRAGEYGGGGGGGGDNGTQGGSGAWPAGGGGGAEGNGGLGSGGQCLISYTQPVTSAANASPTTRYHRNGAGYIKNGSVYKKN